MNDYVIDFIKTTPDGPSIERVEVKAKTLRNAIRRLEDKNTDRIRVCQVQTWDRSIGLYKLIEPREYR